MIGNDIIDLALAKRESNWKRKGFVDKIFTEEEQRMIFNAPDSEQMVWSLWSRKEAVYKIINRQKGIRALIPLKLVCSDVKEINDFFWGEVVCDTISYHTKTEISSEYIHTIAVSDADNFDETEYLLARKNIVKLNTIPYLLDPINLTLKPISISNHGRFERVVFLMQS